MCDKQDWIRVILSPTDKKAFFHPSNLLETLFSTRSQEESEFGFPPKGRYDKDQSNAAQSSKEANLVVWSGLMLIPKRVLLFRLILSPDNRPNTNKINLRECNSSKDALQKRWCHLQIVKWDTQILFLPIRNPSNKPFSSALTINLFKTSATGEN